MLNRLINWFLDLVRPKPLPSILSYHEALTLHELSEIVRESFEPVFESIINRPSRLFFRLRTWYQVCVTCSEDNLDSVCWNCGGTNLIMVEKLEAPTKA